MAAARRATNGVEPMFDNPKRAPLLGYLRVRISRRIVDYQIPTHTY